MSTCQNQTPDLSKFAFPAAFPLSVNSYAMLLTSQAKSMKATLTSLFFSNITTNLSANPVSPAFTHVSQIGWSPTTSITILLFQVSPLIWMIKMPP